jgi:hypothetical protein
VTGLVREISGFTGANLIGSLPARFESGRSTNDRRVLIQRQWKEGSGVRIPWRCSPLTPQIQCRGTDVSNPCVQCPEAMDRQTARARIKFRILPVLRNLRAAVNGLPGLHTVMPVVCVIPAGRALVLRSRGPRMVRKVNGIHYFRPSELPRHVIRVGVSGRIAHCSCGWIRG